MENHMKHIVISGLIIFASTIGFSAFAQDDVGKVGTIVSNLEGGVGFQLQGGFPNNANQCEKAKGSGYAGLPKDAQLAKGMLAIILTAKATDKRVAVAIDGCSKEWSGWYRAYQIYLLD
jgi:hypothetical protein